MWNLISIVQVEKSFQFTNVSTRNVANAIKLTKMTKMNIYPVGDITEVSDNLIKVQHASIKRNVVQVQAIQRNECPSCDKSIKKIGAFQKTVQILQLEIKS